MTAASSVVIPASMPLSGVRVAESGDRIAVTACASLLAQLGAEVFFIEPEPACAPRDKWRNRATSAAGKYSISVASSDTGTLRHILDAADVVLLSSDMSPAPAHAWQPHQIVCDITAFGRHGPWAGLPYSDAQVQALAGIVDTTGDPDSAPVSVGFPILEYCAGMYAAASVVTALRVRRLHGFGQAVDIAMFDCAISALSTFLPFHITGKSVTRAGNRHSLAAPWNAYRAADGWILICTGNDDQWQRLCAVMQQPELASDPGLASNNQRVARHVEVDAKVQAWTATLPVRECVEKLSAVDIPCGPIATVAQLADEPNLLHRRMIQRVHDPLSGRTLTLPGSPLRATQTPGRSPSRIPHPDDDRARVLALCASATPAQTQGAADIRPLAGVRVIEMGQYTTAPLVSRQLGAFGADVLKIEPPSGDGSRNWPPGQDGQGYFFTFSNSDKRSLMLDLRDAGGKARFRQLLADCDVLVENLKPGSLARLGFSAAELNALNPRLVYCSISGFGADSAYPQRPAFDTVVQAMSGFMDLTRCDGTPTKAGISAADIVGGVSSLLAILAAIEYRDRTGCGQHVDISMQDTAAWVTQEAWNDARPQQRAFTVACRDGYVLIDDDARAATNQLVQHDVRFASGLPAARELTRKELAELAGACGLAAAPVCSVAEAVTGEHARARGVLVEGTDMQGKVWPLLNSPLRLEATPPRVQRAIGRLGEANDEVSHRLDQAGTLCGATA